MWDEERAASASDRSGLPRGHPSGSAATAHMHRARSIATSPNNLTRPPEPLGMSWAQLRTPRTSGAAYAIDRPAGRDHYQIDALYADAHKTPITNPARQRDPVDARDLSRHPRHGQIVRDWSTAPKARGKRAKPTRKKTTHAKATEQRRKCVRASGTRCLASSSSGWLRAKQGIAASMQPHHLGSSRAQGSPCAADTVAPLPVVVM
jgi:hypothetical protein